MTATVFPHFVVTRLGIGVHNEDWLHSALGLFEAITFPSLCAVLPGLHLAHRRRP
jgi:hypothetical protein